MQASLNKEEINEVLSGIVDLHQLAYDWQNDVSSEDLLKKCEKAGFLLRTKLRAAIEYLDQLYQYGDFSNLNTEELLKEVFPEISFEEES